MFRLGFAFTVGIIAISLWPWLASDNDRNEKAETTPPPQLGDSIEAWYNKGQFIQVFGYQMFVIDIANNESEAIVFLHGFPTSSYDYHRALPTLQQVFASKRLVFFDHLGFGFSDKPRTDYEFSIHDHAENALALLQMLHIKSAHIVAHDMGDSVLTEILYRSTMGLLPDYFTHFFKVKID